MPRLLLPLALLLAAPLMAATPEPATLTVTAQATVSAAPDMATVGAGVVTQAANAASALEENARRMGKVLAALRRTGVAERDLQTSTLTVQPQYRYGEGRAPEITGYQASNQVQVRLRDLGRVGEVVDTLVREGANTIEGPSFGIDKPEPLLDRARAEAVAQARARAQILAAAAGVRLKRVVALSEGSFRPEPRPLARAMAADASALPRSPVIPGETELVATVTMVFEIE
ncbi:SIMPL domain-containing protein [Thermaurantiacus sp.]